MNSGHNATPYGYKIDETGNTVIFDRLYRPLVSGPGKYPRIKRDQAIACDPSERVYGADNDYFYRPDDQNAARCCPVTRRKLDDLMRSIPALPYNKRFSGAQKPLISQL
jgi:hypothetical protein